MTTVATKNAVFVHIPKTGGTTVMLALAKMNLIEYDYRFQLMRPDLHGLTYDGECRLMKDGKHIDHPHNSNPHATRSQLRVEDRDKPIIQVIRQPHDWYSSFWAHHKRFNWTFTSGMPSGLLRGGATNNFRQWLNNIISGKPPGFCTRYFQMYGGEDCLQVRLEHLIDDWRSVTEHLGLADAADHMNVKRNLNESQERTSLKVPPYIIEQLKTLDRVIYERY